MPLLYCKRCAHSWDSRVPNPKSCPSCHSYKWNQSRKAEEGARLEKQKTKQKPNFDSFVPAKLESTVLDPGLSDNSLEQKIVYDDVEQPP